MTKRSFSDFIRNAPPEEKAEVYGRVIDGAIERQREQLEGWMNHAQQAVLRLLRADPTRDLYEGAAANNSKQGSGYYWVTRSADETYEPLTAAEVGEMTRAGLLAEKWSGCYRLAQSTPCT